ncbi:Holliday junction branch migration protein RuvA [uncultured Bifidobacterium sp.]|uniref:Holliday junction branch migration protein RuvA n=1 Tax=uncultured Bifidobacterium sp. TaxID=165187 RepID=UPI00262921CB|nr:Holliday junction branch migration protein RuvA [uncultured Bifidobacterium sp.]
MIGLLSGTVESVDADTALIELPSGIGFDVRMPSSDIATLRAGRPARVFTVMSMSQDQAALYGFLRHSSRRLFTQLQKTSGIGPKVALSLLSTLGPEDLAKAIVDGDVASLSRAPGLGRKGAQKIILELRGALSPEMARAATDDPSEDASATDDSPLGMVIQGLMSLGWNEQDSATAARRARDAHTAAHAAEPGTDDVAQLLRTALSLMDRGR